jgi:multiple sugar transport system ATP-binding protein
MAVLEFQNVTKKFGKITAVNNMSFKTEEGEFLVILGPSGAGKTTTLKISCGLVNPNEGKVFLDGEDITKVPPYKRDISMTFENYSLYPHMTVFDNMAYPLRANKGEFSEEETKRRIVNIATMLHIDPLLNRFPAEASGGQKQRIALGRTMVRNPKVYLLDEPLAHLDAKIRVELREEFHRIDALKEATTVYVTHDYTEALSLGDRIMILSHGELLQIDAPDNIFYKPVNFEVARQVGQPAINAVECNIHRENNEIVLESEKESMFKMPLIASHKALFDKYNREKVILGVRPQDVSLIPDKDKISIEAVVDVFQPLGSEGVLTTTIGNITVVGLIDPESEIEHSQKVKLFLDSSAFYFFDSETKKNIAL